MAFFTISGAVELVTDQLASTPPRTVPVQLGARIVTGGFSGAVLALAVAQPVILGAVLGAIGAVSGTFGGYHARIGLVRTLKVPDFVIATLEDAITVGGAFFVASRF